MGDAFIFKVGFIIFLLVESDDLGDSDILENINILAWVVAILVVAVPVLNGAHEGHKFTWNDPVQVSVFDSFIVLVLLDIETSEVVPSEFYRKLESLEDVEQGAIIEAISLGGISEMLEEGMVGFDLFISSLSTDFEDDDHEGSHQECSVDHFIAWLFGATIMENPIF